MQTHIGIKHKLHKIVSHLHHTKLHDAWLVLQAYTREQHKHKSIHHYMCSKRLGEALHIWRLHFLRFRNMPKLSLQSPYIKLAVEALRRSYRTNIRIGVFSSRRKLRGKSKLSPLSPKRKTTNGVSAVSCDHFIYGMPVEVILRLIDRKIKLSLYR